MCIMPPLQIMHSVQDEYDLHDPRTETKFSQQNGLARSISLNELPTKPQQQSLPDEAPISGLKRVRSSDAFLRDLAKSNAINASWEAPAANQTKELAQTPSAKNASIQTSPEKPKVKGTRRKTRFNEEVRMRQIRHINDYPADVIEACWITNDEMDEIREKAGCLVNLVDRFPDMLEELGGIYGLEKHTKALAIQRKDQRTRSLGTVLGIQNLQLHKTTTRRFNPEDFSARLYFLQSAKATMDARVYAFELHNEVKALQ